MGILHKCKKKGMCKDSYPPPPGLGEVYQVCWGGISSCDEGKEYQDCGEEYYIEIRERGSNIIFPIILRLLGRISSGEDGKKTGILGKKINIIINGVGEEYQVVGNFIHPFVNV